MCYSRGTAGKYAYLAKHLIQKFCPGALDNPAAIQHNNVIILLSPYEASRATRSWFEYVMHSSFFPSHFPCKLTSLVLKRIRHVTFKYSYVHLRQKNMSGGKSWMHFWLSIFSHYRERGANIITITLIAVLTR